MSGNSLLLDTNILIYLSKGTLDFSKITQGYDKVYLSVISYMEALGYMFNDESERELIVNFLHSLEIVQTDMDIAEDVRYSLH